MTPEQLFLNEKREEPYKQPGFVPTTYLALAKTRFVPSTTQFPYNSGRQELVIMVGAPASGKSFISKMLVNNHGYSIVNQDTLGTKKACETAAQRLLTEGKRVVIDNTNRDPKTR
jgi:bifunctional polynucleotide phosphatase/kinase